MLIVQVALCLLHCMLCALDHGAQSHHSGGYNQLLLGWQPQPFGCSAKFDNLSS
jgi:hypothetical protein